MRDLPQFYVEPIAGVCASEEHCAKPATHRVMRVGKVNYGSYCKQHAEAKARYLARSTVSAGR